VFLEGKSAGNQKKPKLVKRKTKPVVTFGGRFPRRETGPFIVLQHGGHKLGVEKERTKEKESPYLKP